jgi:KaiC/GvpD/RAD55 family RecA-like ATPase
MMNIKEANIPQALRERRQWVVWKTVERDGQKTKLPYQVGGEMAKSNDPKTWNTFDAVLPCLGYDGIGYVFADDDPFCGVDLDGCRDPKTGKCAEWARRIVFDFATYAEVSPSETGVKLFCRGRLPFDTGRKVKLDEPKMGDKEPAIEVYDHLRYFAVTGWRLNGQPHEPQDRQDKIDALCKRYFAEHVGDTSAKGAEFYTPNAVMDRARKYLAKMPPAVSGSGGHDRAFHAACVLVCGFSLKPDEAMQVMREWSQTCQPPWTERELQHKVDDAGKQPGERGYLRNANEHAWKHLHHKTENYKPTKPAKKVEWMTLADAGRQYIGQIRAGEVALIDTGLPDLDAGIGGGVERGEMVVLAARPSHGKSLVALQCTHNWTAAGMPVLFVTEEMSPIALGKRMLQYASALPMEHWKHDIATLEGDLELYEEKRAECYIAANCGTIQTASEQIEKAVKEFGVECVVVDYAQLLSSPGRSRYEQITHTSETLRRLANELRVTILVLCQMSRAIEARKKFEPFMSDIKETGQFEQDADVVLFIIWPHRIDSTREATEFKFYVAKNRNRAINQAVITCRIMPSRQMLVGANYYDTYSRSYVEPYKELLDYA